MTGSTLKGLYGKMSVKEAVANKVDATAKKEPGVSAKPSADLPGKANGAHAVEPVIKDEKAADGMAA